MSIGLVWLVWRILSEFRETCEAGHYWRYSLCVSAPQRPAAAAVTSVTQGHRSSCFYRHWYTFVSRQSTVAALRHEQINVKHVSASETTQIKVIWRGLQSWWGVGKRRVRDGVCRSQNCRQSPRGHQACCQEQSDRVDHTTWTQSTSGAQVAAEGSNSTRSCQALWLLWASRFLHLHPGASEQRQRLVRLHHGQGSFEWRPGQGIVQRNRHHHHLLSSTRSDPQGHQRWEPCHKPGDRPPYSHRLRIRSLCQGRAVPRLWRYESVQSARVDQGATILLRGSCSLEPGHPPLWHGLRRHPLRARWRYLPSRAYVEAGHFNLLQEPHPCMPYSQPRQQSILGQHSSPPLDARGASLRRISSRW